MKSHSSIKSMIVFAMLGALMFAAKVAFEALPNIHPVAMLIMTYTVAYRAKALVPLYLFIILFGTLYGFSIWWLPYLYIWLVPWALTMLLPKKMSPKIASVVYPLVCGFCGLTYGICYAPAQAILFHYDFATMCKWILAGLPFDALHGLGNLGMGLLVLPLSELLKRLNRTANL